MLQVSASRWNFKKIYYTASTILKKVLRRIKLIWFPATFFSILFFSIVPVATMEVYFGIQLLNCMPMKKTASWPRGLKHSATHAMQILQFRREGNVASSPWVLYSHWWHCYLKFCQSYHQKSTKSWSVSQNLHRKTKSTIVRCFKNKSRRKKVKILESRIER